MKLSNTGMTLANLIIDTLSWGPITYSQVTQQLVEISSALNILDLVNAGQVNAIDSGNH
jgi:hypothetical protein